MELHCRLGHIAPHAIRELIAKHYVTGVEIILSDEPEACKACIHAKSTRWPIPTEREGVCSSTFREEVHSDIWGPSQVTMLGGRKYYVSFTDDATRYSTLYLLHQKSDTFEAFHSFNACLVNHQGAHIKFLNTDPGGEYLNDKFSTYLQEHGIEAKLSVHNVHGQSGVSERLN
ncbi:hypothetical protein IEO21_10406 [Rhodonia placenta]|uniref:Integrase catalytic domain-containing protein n=1 Tax=Rhodonia placenta TaxID=104341 RepID=A0A8H7TWT8_9APHY|nr:hypothetical protein IEO21_10406 [Postia placenta]